ncbi:MAG TPA: DUF4145 domain-containing protein [Actinospica sp.]|jgi:hypothetical protein|nr:DUF4145 domain-containing protein [Actinospica sp.]
MSEVTRVGVSFPLVCPHCEKTTVSTVLSSAPGGGREEPPYLLELAKCGTCHEPFLLVEEDYGQGWDGDPFILWPQRQRPLSLNIPESLREEHEEARRAFSAKAYRATAVMVRRTLEGVCLDQGMAKKQLFQMLEQMRNDDKIDGRLFEWAQELRVLGNEGAHYTGNAVSREDASDGLALAEALLDYLYVLTAQFDAFKARRAASQQSTSSSAQPSASGTGV